MCDQMYIVVLKYLYLRLFPVCWVNFLLYDVSKKQRHIDIISKKKKSEDVR